MVGEGVDALISLAVDEGDIAFFWPSAFRAVQERPAGDEEMMDFALRSFEWVRNLGVHPQGRASSVWQPGGPLVGYFPSSSTAGGGMRRSYATSPT